MANHTDTQTTNCLPEYMQDTLLAEVITELAAIKPEEFTWPDNPIAEGEQVLGHADEYTRRLYTLRNNLTDRRKAAVKDFYQSEDHSDEERATENRARVAQKKYNVCDALLWGHIVSKYAKGGRDTSGEALRVDGTIVALGRNEDSVGDNPLAALVAVSLGSGRM